MNQFIDKPEPRKDVPSDASADSDDSSPAGTSPGQRTAEDHPPSGIWEWHLQDDELIIDEHVQAILGHQPQDMDALFDLIDPDVRQTIRQSLIQSLESGQDVREQFHLCDDDTHPTKVEVVGRLIDGAHGEPERIVGTIRRLTRAPETEPAQTFQSAMDDPSSEAVFILEPETGEILDATLSGIDQLGYNRDELLNLGVTDISSDIDSKQDWQDLVQRARENGTITEELIHTGHEGKTFHAEARLDHVDINGSDVLVLTSRDISERRELERKHKNFQRAVDASGHGILITDPDGTIVYANPAFEQMSGYSESELTGKTPRILESGFHDPPFFQDLWETISSGQVWDGEIVNQTKSGERFHTQQTIAPVEGEHGDIEAFISIQEDVTDQKQREQELYEKSRAIDQSPVGITIADATQEDDPLVYINEGFEEITGYDRDEMIGENCRFLQGEETDPETVREIRHALDNNSEVHVELRNYTANGELFWNELIISPIRDEDGNVTRYVGYQQDVTERKTSKQTLQLFRDSMNKSAEEIFIVDPETARFLDVTRSAQENLGYSMDELLDMTAHDINPELGEDLNWDELVEDLMQNGPLKLETTHRRADGSTFPVEARADHVVTDDGPRIVATAFDITERLERQEKIEQQAQLLNQINDRMPGVSFQFRRSPDGSYSIPHLSDGFAELSGVSTQEALDSFDQVVEQVHPEDRDAYLQSIEESAERLEPWKHEFRFVHPDGDVTWIRGSSVPEQQPDGSILWTGIAYDVTEEMEQTRKLRHQKKRFQTVFNNAPIGIWEEDWSSVKEYIDGMQSSTSEPAIDHLQNHPELAAELGAEVEVIMANDTMVNMADADSEQHLLDGFRELLVNDDAYDSVREEVIELLTGNRSSSSTMRLRTFSGEELQILRTFQLVPGHESDWSRVFVTYQDITERIEMQNQLRRSEQRYRTLFEEANEPFLIEDLNDNILDANHAACDLLGYDRDELSGMNKTRLRPEEVIEEYGEENIARSLLDEHGSDLFRTEYLHRDGSRVPVEAKYQTFDYDRDTRAVLACLRDRSELEQLRTESARKSTFVSRVTHDLRTPLNSILGMGQLLVETDLSPEQQERLRLMLNATRTMERLTNDIMDLERIEQGDVSLEETTFDLGNLLGEVLSLYNQTIRDRDLMMSSRIADDVPESLIGDPDRLKQILHNLVDNAVKHTEEGMIEVTVKVKDERASSSGIRLEFSVSDTGEGIPEEEQSGIFERGKQVKDGDTPDSTGIGLGLSICQNFVELMDGEISVDSQVGEGTTFTFTAELEEGRDQQEVSLEDRSVLIVDDNQHLLNVLTTYLESRDVQVTQCTSGEEARRELHRTDDDGSSPYDAAFLDNRLDETSGLDLVDELHRTPDGIDPERVHIISGDPRQQIYEQLDRLEVADVLEKPISESMLVSSVRTTLDEQSGPPEGETDAVLTKIRVKSRVPLDLLMVEDNPETQDLLNRFLEPITSEVTAVSSGKDGLQQYRERSPDLMLVDLELAGPMDGLDIIERVRELELEQALEPVPIITQTALAMKHAKQRCLEAGADAFIRKPIEQLELLRTIETVLNTGIDDPE